MTFAIGYARQSLARAGEDEDTSLSLDAQDHAIRAFCDKQGWTITEVLRDHDLKGNDPTRPGIKKLLASIGAQMNVVVFSLSRLARDNILQEMIYRQIKTKGGNLVSVTEPHAENDLVRGIMGVINEEERRKQGRMVKIAAEQRFRRGQAHGTAPFGYRNDAGGLVIEEREAALVRELFERVAGGTPGRQMMLDWNARGVPSPYGASRWSTTTIYRLLRNPTYAGGLHFNRQTSWPEDGEVWHEPLVSRAVFERAQEQIQKRKSHTPRTKQDASPYEGMVIHVCGRHAYLRGAGLSASNTPYLQFCCASLEGRGESCAFTSRSISRNKIERAVPELLAHDLEGLPDPKTQIANALAAHEAKAPGVMARQDELLAQIGLLDARVKRAEALWMDGMRSIEWFRGHEAEIGAERERLFVELETLPAPMDLDRLRRMVQLIDKSRRTLRDRSPAALAQLLGDIGKVQYGPDGITIVYDPALAPLIPHPLVIPNLGRNDARPSRTF